MIDARAFVETLDGKPVAVFGLARTGLSVVRALCAAGAKIKAWDDKEEARSAAQAMGAEVAPLDVAALQECAALVLAPGVPLYFPAPHDVVVAARAVGIEIICDIELFYRCKPDHIKIVGITGTNGKSTTTSLLGHVLNACGAPAAIGGNIGLPALEMNVDLPVSIAVLELSSYQLDLCPTLALDVAVLLNITPDHLDRHGGMDGYAKAKARIFEGAGTAIITGHDPYSLAMTTRVGEMPATNLVLPNLVDGVENLNLRGDHNAQNMAAALAVSIALGRREQDVLAAFETYPGLAHRQFFVREINNVSYVNDSKATNAEAAEKALKSYDDIFWIVGGQAKEGGLDGLEGLMNKVKHSYLIGEAADDFARWMTAQGAPYTLCETLSRAAGLAHDAAQKNGGGVVLLSPACASWDQFDSFEHRGDEFAKLVEAL